MKRIAILFGLIFVLIAFVGCLLKSHDSYVLNWGDYMDASLIDEFEAEFDVRVFV
ncbi:MAG: hypothetical protein MZU97_04115 [Bacillus subtilis]|nr:hypothetical protein [Bacillus subtilis]